MYYQDSIIAAQSDKIELWKRAFEHQKNYSDKCDTARLDCMTVAKKLEASNERLARQNHKKSNLLKLSGALNIVLLLLLL
jgi:hypothetical protein